MKKLTSVLLILLFLLSSALPISANYTPQKIKTIHGNITGELVHAELDGSSVPMIALTSLTVSPGSELRVYLFGNGGASLFYDQDGIPIATADATLSRMRAAQIDLTVSGLSGLEGQFSAELAYSIKTQTLPTAAPYISVRFMQEDCIVEPIDFSLQLSLTVAGAVHEGATLSLAGVIRPELQPIAAGTTSIDISGGVVAVPDTNLESVNLVIGEGMVLTTDLLAGVKYCASVKPRSIPSEMPVTAAYTLQVVGFNQQQSTVRIESDTLQYVYDGQGIYLGTTRTPLPLLPEYYLTEQRVQRIEMES